MGLVSDLIKEIPLSVNLQSKLEEIESKSDILETENKTLKSNLENAAKEIDRLNKVTKSLQKAQSAEKCTKVEEQILQSLFKNDQYFEISKIAALIGTDNNTAKYHIANLLEKKLIHKSIKIMDKPTTYKINKKGIKYVVELQNL